MVDGLFVLEFIFFNLNTKTVPLITHKCMIHELGWFNLETVKTLQWCISDMNLAEDTLQNLSFDIFHG